MLHVWISLYICISLRPNVGKDSILESATWSALSHISYGFASEPSWIHGFPLFFWGVVSRWLKPTIESLVCLLIKTHRIPGRKAIIQSYRRRVFRCLFGTLELQGMFGWKMVGGSQKTEMVHPTSRVSRWKLGSLVRITG